MRFPPRRRHLLLFPALLLGACASLAPGDAIHDLAAIHDPADWSPRSPAAMRLTPESYLGGGRVDSPFRIGEPQRYPVADHRRLELAILEAVWTTPALDYGLSLEATGWLVIQLLQDDHDLARKRAAAILGSFAAGWIHGAGARLPAAEPDGDLAAAVQAYLAAALAPEVPESAARASAALARLDQARIDDPFQAARLVAGLGRHFRASAAPVTGRGALARTGLRTVLLALERGEADPSAEVAQTCRVLRQELVTAARAE
ncbi:MAG: hypothetical protein ISR76_01090 [Planctomycetes bacterium]|nr:hypothetical protein [Planctomycetota bacterium]MBL7007564.1 hypothetical protein [Planctomycetota bacterium]